MITVKERSFEISAGLRHIGYEKDNLVETRTFCIKNKELFGMEFFIDLENTLESNLLEKAFSSDENEMLLTWNISSGCLKKPGVITFQLRGVDAEGEKVWHSTKDYFLSGNSIDTYSDVTEDEANSFIQLEKNVVSLKNETQALSDSARESSLTAKEYSENASALCDELREDYNGFKEQLYTKDEVNEKLENKSNKQTVTAHTENLKNPHGVTAEQVGAYTKAQVDDRLVYWQDRILYKMYHDEIDTTSALHNNVIYLYNAISNENYSVYESVPFETAVLFNNTQPFAGFFGLPTVVQTAIADDGLVYVRKIQTKDGFDDEYNFSVQWECKTYTKEEVDGKIGSIDTALDELHDYAQALIGGEA